MYDRQNSQGSVNVILHMDTGENFQVVPSEASSTCKPSHTDGFVTYTTYNTMDQHSTIDFNQIPLTVNSDFFTTDSNEDKDSDHTLEEVSGVNGQYVYTDQRIVGPDVSTGQRWSPVPPTETRTDGHTDGRTDARRTVVEDFQFNAGNNVSTGQRWSPGAAPHTDTHVRTDGHMDGRTDTRRTVVEDFQFNAGNNLELQKAADQALQSGTILPLVKEELKCSIQSKRLKEGKGELVVSFEEPIPDKLSPEEEEKVELRRTQNRQAARRFRDKQKRKTDSLEKECRRLELENSTLRSEKSKLKRERDDLSAKFQQHLTICQLQRGVHPGFYTNTT